MTRFIRQLMLLLALSGLAACSSTGGLQEDGASGKAEVVEQPAVEGSGDDAVGTDGTTASGAQTGSIEAPYSFEGRPIKGASDPADTWLVYFELDSSKVAGRYQDMLAAHANYLAAHPDARMTIEGHADERGSREYNIALGERRARAVRDLLVLLGAAPKQLSMVSYGEERPADPGHNEAAWRLNRRAVLIYTR